MEFLTRPFPPEAILQRKGHGGKMHSYIPTFAVVERLNEACDNGWSFEVVKHEIVEDGFIVIGKLIVDGVVKMAFGGATITRDAEGPIIDLGDTAKSAARALSKCRTARATRH